MAEPFYPIFLAILIALLIAAGLLGTGYIVGDLLGLRRKNPVKLMPYESGMDPIGTAHQRYDVRYYLIAIMFLLFDVELLFLYPWAVAAYGTRPLTTCEQRAIQHTRMA